MSDRHDDIQGWLTVLGQARRDGACTSDANRYPWRTAELEASRPALRRFAWVRVAAPLAAAAIVAVLFVVPALLRTPTSSQVAEAPANVTPEGSPKAALADASETVADDCDFNHDGVVDGRDIKAFVERKLQGSDEDIRLETERLQRCLLGI